MKSRGLGDVFKRQVTDKAKDVILPLIEAGKEVHINLKDVAAELKKCELGETNVMSNNLKCDDRKTSGKVKDGTNSALGSEFKNPYKTSASAIVTTTLSACNTTTEGQTSISDDGTTVTVKSCTANGETLLSGTVTIE